MQSPSHYSDDEDRASLQNAGVFKSPDSTVNLKGLQWVLCQWKLQDVRGLASKSS